MDASALLSLAAVCSPQVHSSTVAALVSVESSMNPHAIGVIGGVLERQPRSRAEAVATARSLHAAGWNFSLGLAQINVGNFRRLGLDLESALHPCSNLSAMQAVLMECFDRARKRRAIDQHALQQALSCYYSGNFSTGFRHGYVRRVMRAAAHPSPPPAETPALPPATTKEFP